MFLVSFGVELIFTIEWISDMQRSGVLRASHLGKPYIYLTSKKLKPVFLFN